MQIRARMSMSADGYVTTPSGWPALTANPAFVSGKSHGIREFLEGCEAALMSRTTFDLRGEWACERCAGARSGLVPGLARPEGDLSCRRSGGWSIQRRLREPSW
jgi:hypothetical protein